MFKRRPKSKLTREQSLAMKPVHLVDAELSLDETGNGKLSIQVQPTRVARLFIKGIEGRRKTFELDPVGVAFHEATTQRQQKILYRGTDKTTFRS